MTSLDSALKSRDITLPTKIHTVKAMVFLVVMYRCEEKNVKILVTQLCLTLCDPMGCSLTGSSVHGILQARILEWVAIPYSRGSFQPRDQTQSSALQTDSLPSEPPGKPMDVRTGP